MGIQYETTAETFGVTDCSRIWMHIFLRGVRWRQAYQSVRKRVKIENIWTQRTEVGIAER